MTTQLTLLLAVLAAGMVVATVVINWWLNRSAHAHHDDYGAIPLFFAADGSQPIKYSVASASRTEALPVSVRGALPTEPPTEPPVTTAGERGIGVTSVSDLLERPRALFDTQHVRFSVPADRTLQFLPGSLTIESGPDAGREIRFVHQPGVQDSDVTFGRSEGELYRHVQLVDQTVSRQHATLQWRAGQWLLHNQSATNPVLLNGRVLDGDERPALQDGDHVEMGAVLFTFHRR